jgi:glycosyltransferase involved in cell wall biosynthesis
MRILLVSFIPNAPWTGMGRWTHAVADALARLGHQATMWFADDFPGVQRSGRWAVLAFPPVLAWRLWRERRAFDAVVIHEPSGLWYGVLRRLVPPRPPLPPLITMCHNVERRHFRTMVQYTRLGIASVPRASLIKAPWFRYWQTGGAIRLADHVLCLSSVDREYVTRELGVRADRVTRLANGAPPPDSTGPPLNGHAVLWVGGWLDVKGSRILPPLWHEVLQALPDASLTLVGTGALSATVLGAFTQQDHASVRVLPRVEDWTAMHTLYRSHDVYLMSSLSEGSPLSLLEAMAAGLPCVSTRVGGVADLVTHDREALLFEPVDPGTGARHLVRLLTDREAAKRLSAAGRARAGALTWDATAQALAQAVARTLSPHDA